MAILQAEIEVLLPHRLREERCLCLGQRQGVYCRLYLLGEGSNHRGAFPQRQPVSSCLLVSARLLLDASSAGDVAAVTFMGQAYNRTGQNAVRDARTQYVDRATFARPRTEKK